MSSYKGISQSKRQRVMAKTGGLCWYCGEIACTVDHIFPWSRKKVQRPTPRNNVKNLLPACEPCNKAKGNMLLDEFREFKRVVRFWGERFLPSGVQI